MTPEGVLTDEPLQPEDAVLASCYQAAATGRELLGERAGQPTLRLVGLPPERPNKRKAGLVAEVRGVNVHADRAIDGRDRKQIERLCRYMARPPLANDRLHAQPDGRLRYTMKKIWSDGTAAIVMDPLSFIGRLCALIPPPRMHMLRFCGVLAAHSKLRAEVVPACTPVAAAHPVGCHEARQVPEQLALFGQSAALLPIAQPRQDADAPPYPFGYHTPSGVTPLRVSRSASKRVEARRPSRHAWAFLMQHVFAKDVLACPHCQGRLRIVEVAKTTEAIARVLADVGLGPRAPPRLQAAWPAQLTLALG